MSDNARHGPYAREHPRAWIKREPEELSEGWVDDLVRRQLEEWNRQMIKLETASKKESSQASDTRTREQNARTLAMLQRQLKEVLRMENDRAAKRATRHTNGAEDAVAALERRLDQLVERERAQGVSAKSGSGQGENTR